MQSDNWDAGLLRQASLADVLLLHLGSDSACYPFRFGAICVHVEQLSIHSEHVKSIWMVDFSGATAVSCSV